MKSILNLCVPICCLIWPSIIFGQVPNPDIKNPPKTAEGWAKFMETKGVMSASEYLKLKDISPNNSLIPSISDADVNWLVQLIHTPPPTKGTMTRRAAGEARIADISLFICASAPVFTKQQENELYPCAVWLCSSSDPVYREQGAPIIGYLHDSRGIPILLKLSKESNADVRREARDALRHIPGAPILGPKA